MNQEPIAELSLYISKVSVDKANGGEMRWRATASDTSPDLYQERMSNELYDDFIRRIDSGEKVPMAFRNALGEEWDGGMPYVSVSHYKSGTSQKNVPGMPTKIYRDGNALKATGNLFDNAIGRAVFKSLCDDLYSEKARTEGKIRISIGFLDLEHKHLGEGNTPDYTFERKSLDSSCPMCQEGKVNKVYTKGQLVHLALTRVPVNPRTNMEVAKAMTIETRKQDAESIIGELSDTLEEKSLVNNLLVTKSDEVEVEVEKAKVDEISAEAKEEEAEKKENAPKAKTEKAKVASDKKTEELTYEEDDEEKREERRNRPAGERSLLQKSFDEIESRIVEMKSQNVPAETALREIQPAYNALGEQIKKSIQPELAVGQTNDYAELVSVVKSLAETVTAMQQATSTEIATLKAQILSGGAVRQLSQGIPTPRSLNPNNLPAQATPQAPLAGVPNSIRSLALKSTFTR